MRLSVITSLTLTAAVALAGVTAVSGCAIRSEFMLPHRSPKPPSTDCTESTRKPVAQVQEETIRELIGRMSTAEKIGQLLVVGMSAA